MMAMIGIFFRFIIGLSLIGVGVLGAKLVKNTWDDFWSLIHPDKTTGLQINEERKESSQMSRPHISIKPDKIEYGSWTDQEKADDPGITERCDKIILYFWMRNATNQPASNVDMNVTSQIIDEKGAGNLSEVERNISYLHSLHLITNKASGRQPFILALDKKATNYFKNGVIKVQLAIKVNYTNLNNNESYWSEGTYIYSPTFKNNAIEISSGGI